MSTSPSRSNASSARFELFAVTAPGLESIAAGELKTLGVKGRQEPGGVAFGGDLDRVYLANLWLRTASRLLLRLGRFHASTFYELERRAKKLAWADFLPSSGPVEVRVTCRKSRLYHSDAVAERVLSAIARVAPAGVDLKIGATTSEEDDDAEKSLRQLIVVRIVDDQCEVSADTSGELLHRRGYRQEIARAPLRETLAAAMVLASGWDKRQPLLDPMCGSGTIPIEAALIARRTAPGLARNFQFMEWASFDRRLWNETTERAKEAIVGVPLDIRGADRDAGATQAATRNAERAGVASDIRFSTQSISGSLAALEDLADGKGEGWIITNPPYGIRVGESADLRDLYATMGNAITAKRGWRVGILAAQEYLAGQTGLPLRSRFDTRNGGISVSYLVNEKPARMEPSVIR
jgi:putative N6-adenine-specific DNA methylase